MSDTTTRNPDTASTAALDPDADYVSFWCTRPTVTLTWNAEEKAVRRMIRRINRGPAAAVRL